MPAHSSATGADLHEAKRLKEPARVVSVTNISLAVPGATIDSVALASGDRILLTGQTAPAENGPYTWAGAATLLVRTPDADSAADFPLGWIIYVREGTTYGSTFWVYTQSATVTLGSTSLTFSNVSALGPTGPTGPQGVQGLAGSPGPPGSFLVSGAAPHICIEDRKTQNTQGGGFTSGADQIRTLTQISEDTNSLARLASNQFTLPAGTYRYDISAPAYNVGSHQAMLWTVTGGAVIRRGSTEYSQTGADATMSCSRIRGRMGLRSAETFEVRHRCQSTRGTAGFCVAANFGYEVYTVVDLWLEGGPPPFFGAVLDMPIRRPWQPLPREGTIEHSIDTTP